VAYPPSKKVIQSIRIFQREMALRLHAGLFARHIVKLRAYISYAAIVVLLLREWPGRRRFVLLKATNKGYPTCLGNPACPRSTFNTFLKTKNLYHEKVNLDLWCHHLCNRRNVRHPFDLCIFVVYGFEALVCAAQPQRLSVKPGNGRLLG
jgi:hypothetical protein